VLSAADAWRPSTSKPVRAYWAICAQLNRDEQRARITGAAIDVDIAWQRGEVPSGIAAGVLMQPGKPAACLASPCSVRWSGPSGAFMAGFHASLMIAARRADRCCRGDLVRTPATGSNEVRFGC